MNLVSDWCQRNRERHEVGRHCTKHELKRTVDVGAYAERVVERRRLRHVSGGVRTCAPFLSHCHRTDGARPIGRARRLDSAISNVLYRDVHCGRREENRGWRPAVNHSASRCGADGEEPIDWIYIQEYPPYTSATKPMFAEIKHIHNIREFAPSLEQQGQESCPYHFRRGFTHTKT